MSLNIWGSFCFGIVMGWVTYRTLRRTQTNGINDIATVAGTLGGAAITNLWSPETGAFGSYCIGLLTGFVGYLITSLVLLGKEGRDQLSDWLGLDLPAESEEGKNL